MGIEFTAKSFKSGNSIAIRIPAALGVEPDREWTVEEKGRRFDLSSQGQAQPQVQYRKKVRGCAAGSGLKPIKSEDRIFRAQAVALG
ncbi:hypothetical protein ACFSTD_09515 [Novosphingobium colocasiae]